MQSCNDAVFGRVRKYKLRYSKISITKLLQLACWALKLLDFNRKKICFSWFFKCQAATETNKISVYCSRNQLGVSLVFGFFGNSFFVSLSFDFFETNFVPVCFSIFFQTTQFWFVVRRCQSQLCFSSFFECSKTIRFQFIFRAFQQEFGCILCSDLSEHDLKSVCFRVFPTQFSLNLFFTFAKNHLVSVRFSWAFSKTLQF